MSLIECIRKIIIEYKNSWRNSIKTNSKLKLPDNILKDIIKFKIGDRVMLKNKQFEEIYVITNIRFTKPISYFVEDLNKDKIIDAFYENDLEKTNF